MPDTVQKKPELEVLLVNTVHYHSFGNPSSIVCKQPSALSISFLMLMLMLMLML